MFEITKLFRKKTLDSVYVKEYIYSDDELETIQEFQWSKLKLDTEIDYLQELADKAIINLIVERTICSCIIHIWY